MAIQIKDRVQQLLGREFSASLCFDYPTIATLVEHLLEQLFPERETDGSGPRALPDIRVVPRPMIDEGQVQNLSDEQIAALIDVEMKA